MLDATPYEAQVEEIERGLARRGLALGVDWSDEAQVRALAREALDCRLDQAHPECFPTDRIGLVKVELFGLAQLMLTLMRHTAEMGIHSHGGPVWKAFGRALWQEAQKPR
jgi:hypothetical protein